VGGGLHRGGLPVRRPVRLVHAQQRQGFGLSAGYGAGYTEAKDEKAAAAWANTPEGRLAYRFAQSGELQRLARCNGKGWKVEKGVCYPMQNSDGNVYGWALP